ncbi:MAG: carbohydrate-binding protein [Streptomyces sp.]|nr:carbohydrate-binding protein [Streptomyces sp.]
MDRIALKDTATGKYVTAGTGETGAPLTETADSGTGAQFDVFDWGSGLVTLRSAANGKYVGYNWSNFVNDQKQPNGWYVQQYFTGQALYPFGYGLSYTTFAYSGLRRVGDGYEVKVTNTGSRAGAEVVQLYTHQRTSREEQPLKQLKSFQRVSLKPVETRTVRLKVRPPDLAHWDVARSKWTVESGTYDVLVGSSSSDIRARTSWQVKGETIPPRDLSKTTRAENFDDYSAGIALVDESKASGTAVSAASDGAWLKFADTRLGSDAGEFGARVAGTSSGTVEVRLGSPTGTLVGTAHFAGTSSPYDYTTVTAKLSGATKGRTDVYLVLSKDLRLSEFSLR